jgi:methyltransferase
MLSRWLFTGLVLLVIAQRLWEVRLSRAHEQKLRARGALEHAAGQMPWMVALHAGWLASTVLEVWLLRPSFSWLVALPALALFGLGQALRLIAMRTLGERWTVRVITLRNGEPAVAQGIYRHLRHPNYAGVVLEIAALPLVHGAVWSALGFSVLNALLLRARIQAEERALAETGPYAEQFRERPRFVPGVSRA